MNHSFLSFFPFFFASLFLRKVCLIRGGGTCFWGRKTKYRVACDNGVDFATSTVASEMTKGFIN